MKVSKITEVDLTEELIDRLMYEYSGKYFVCND